MSDSNHFDPSIFAPLVPPQAAALPVSSTDVFAKQNREMQKVSKAIVLASYIGTVICLVSTCIIITILVASTTLSQDRKVFFATILCVITIGIQIVILLVRSDPTTLILLTVVSAPVNSFAAGLACIYA